MTNKEGTINLLDYLPESAVNIDVKGQTKKEVLSEMVKVLCDAHKLENSDKIFQALLEREELGSTGIGLGIAIPHGKSDDVSQVVAALGITKRGIDFEALDGEPVYLFFMLVAPTNSSGVHLKILAKISRLLKDKFFRQALREAKSPADIIHHIREESDF